MFDVRPVDETGDLDWKKIQAIGGQNFSAPDFENENFAHNNAKSQTGKAYILGVPVESELAPVFHDPNFNIDDFNGDQAVDDELQRKYQMLEQQIEKRRLEEQEKIAQQIARQQQINEQALRHRLELEKMSEMRKKEEEMRNQQMQEEKERREQERILQLEIEKREIQKQKEILEKLQLANREKEMAIAAEKARLQAEREENIKREAFERKMHLQQIAENNRAMQLSYEETVISERKKRQLEYEKYLLEEEGLNIAAEEKKKVSKPSWWFSQAELKKRKAVKKDDLHKTFSLRNLFDARQFPFQFQLQSNIAMFMIVAIVFSFGIGGISFASKGLAAKGRVLGVSQSGFENLSGAVSDMSHQNFESSSMKFSEALENFSQGSQDLEEMGGLLVSATRYIPFASKVSSGKNALEAGKHFSAAGQSLNEVVKISSNLKGQNISNSDVSLLDVLENAEKNIANAKMELVEAQKNINLISIDDLPSDKQAKFLLLKEKMPDILSAIDLFLDNNHILVDLLGGNGPRKYLFLFQNNTEMRATGGFIGSYGMLDIANGHVKNFFIDGIFNPDGQLKDRIVPPMPIQKISANWSMHDSNWFADFPTSAKKAIYFYEKTGGPTADGVITVTPTVMQKLLKITGPIEMPEYDVTLDSENFIQQTQYEVEVDYDKKENKPKKILSDLAPLVMEKLLSSKDLNSISLTAQALLEGLGEKHILLYSQNAELEKIISKQGWSGEILPVSKDYVSVINTNINGYKTDAVVKENISHKAEIQPDGSIVDTLSITRKHEGGSSHYDWLNKVNADYMRVYVPQGSKLLEVSGQTRETTSSPLDYDSLGFKRDEDVEREEQSVVVDTESGTRIYSESGKTVFANWAYVSPGESVTITYKYILPFSLFQVSVGSGGQIDSYSLAMQKQSGSLGSNFQSEITFPEEYEVKWNFPEQAEKNGNQIKTNGVLDTDRFVGAVFEKRN